jgi:hypothetical protein
MIPRGTTFEFEYLGEFEIEIKNILEHESGAHMGLIHEKNQRPKISCYCTFKRASTVIQYLNRYLPKTWHGPAPEGENKIFRRRENLKKTRYRY